MSGGAYIIGPCNTYTIQMPVSAINGLIVKNSDGDIVFQVSADGNITYLNAFVQADDIG